MSKSVRILAASTPIPPDPRPLGEFYDYSLGYSVVRTDVGLTAVLEVLPSAGTVSKTKSYPGDDDDDPGLETCY